jgi:hypothetical protein
MSIEETKRRREERLRRQQQEQANVVAPAVLSPQQVERPTQAPVDQAGIVTAMKRMLETIHRELVETRKDVAAMRLEVADVREDVADVREQLRSVQQVVLIQQEILSLLKTVPAVPAPTGATVTVKGIPPAGHTFTAQDLYGGEEVEEDGEAAMSQDDLDEDGSDTYDDDDDHEFAEEDEVVAAVPSSLQQKRVSSPLQQLQDGEPRALMLPVLARTQTRKVRRLKDV